MSTGRRGRQTESERWLQASLPWSRYRTEDILNGKEYFYAENWKTTVEQLCHEINDNYESLPVLGFGRCIEVCRLIREHFANRDEKLSSALLSMLNEQISKWLMGIKEKSELDFFDALTHEGLDTAAVVKTFFDDLSVECLLSLLERLSNVTEPKGKRLTPLIEDLAQRLELGDLIAAADRFVLWSRLNPEGLVQRLIRERWCEPPFVSAVAQTLQHLESSAKKIALLNASLAMCYTCDNPETAQQLRFRLFSDTLGVPFAREYLLYLPLGSDRKAKQDYLLQRAYHHPSRGLAMLFFAEWPDLDRAAEIALTLPLMPLDIDAWQLERASLLLEVHSPEIALRLLRQASHHPSLGLLETELTSARDRGTRWFATWPSG